MSVAISNLAHSGISIKAGFWWLVGSMCADINTNSQLLLMAENRCSGLASSSQSKIRGLLWVCVVS
jgi:hypothetical protein